MTKTEIKEALKKLGYTVQAEPHDNYCDLMAEGVRAATVSYRVNELPHCCGVEEIGNVELIQTGLVSKKIPVKALNLLFAYAFLSERTNGIEKGSGRIPRVYCGNGVQTSTYAEEALLKIIPDAYNHVSTSKNPGSGRTIKVFISK